MNIQLTILTALNNVHPRLMPEGTLLADVRLLSGRAMPKGDFDLALRQLDGAGHVLGLSNQDTGNLWKITDAGKARLLEANQ